MFGFNPASLLNVYRGQPSSRFLSPRIWTQLGKMLTPDGYQGGVLIGSDFRNFGLTTAVASNVGRYADQSGVYLSYEDTGGSIAQLATEKTGAIRITTDGTDNDEMWMQPGGATSVLGMVSDTAGDDRALAFECRFRLSSVAAVNMFSGLSEEGLAAADTITDAGALASKDLLGFWVLEDAPTTLKFGYRKAGQAAVVVGSYDTALEADTWVKAGFLFDPRPNISGYRISFFVNNGEQADKVTASNIAAATFPDGEELNALFGVKNGGAAAKALDLDWWGFGQAN